ncbi:hypothetical protein IAQ61_010755 [Plenodomus lingam]|uniref:uncharacterized protein n=1 Tax=Leptosphaeria maculans TaxID=5022 RepID=UPI003329AA10|nr:hypothetical protein IAQ61_010755 [Plenodomus lingam]
MDRRSKEELIKVNAVQVAPARIEAIFIQCNAVTDAAAVSITLDGQEWPRAYITPKDEFKDKLQRNIYIHT